MQTRHETTSISPGDEFIRTAAIDIDLVLLLVETVD
jgi:hypothetical protein